jgi:preprotein translocase subunit SecB
MKVDNSQGTEISLSTKNYLFPYERRLLSKYINMKRGAVQPVLLTTINMRSTQPVSRVGAHANRTSK